MILTVCCLATYQTATAAKEDEYVLDIVDTIRGSVSFDKVKIVDLRVDKSNVGYVRTGVANRKNVLITPDGFDNVLNKFVISATQFATHKDERELIVFVREYKLADRPNAGEMGTFYVRMDFYLQGDAGYMPALQVDSFFEISSSWDVTKSLKNLASQKMGKWLKAVSATNVKSLAKNQKPFEEIVQAYANENLPFPIYNQQPNKGVYYSFEEFINNSPKDTAFHQKNYSTDGKLVPFFYQNLPNNKKGKSFEKLDCFAIYNGKKWYKKSHFGMLEMKYEDGDFYFFDLGYGVKTSDEVVVMFGLVGAMIANGSQRQGKAVYRMRLDPNTGEGVVIERR